MPDQFNQHFGGTCFSNQICAPFSMPGSYSKGFKESGWFPLSQSMEQGGGDLPGDDDHRSFPRFQGIEDLANIVQKGSLKQLGLITAISLQFLKDGIGMLLFKGLQFSENGYLRTIQKLGQLFNRHWLNIRINCQFKLLKPVKEIVPEFHTNPFKGDDYLIIDKQGEIITCGLIVRSVDADHGSRSKEEKKNRLTATYYYKQCGNA